MKTAKEYEEVWQELCEYGIINVDEIMSQDDLIDQLTKNMDKKKFSSNLVEKMIDTDAYKKAVDKNLQAKVTKTKTTDTITDGYTMKITRGNKVVYKRQGKEVTYYKSKPRRWQPEELKFLETNKGMPTKQLIYKYNAKFIPRTIGSIQSRVYRL